MQHNSQKAIPHLDKVKAFAASKGLPFFFIKDLMKAEKIYSNNIKILHEAGWVAGNIVRSKNAGELDGCSRLVELFRLKWISDRKINPPTTLNAWLLYEQLHKSVGERLGEITLHTINFDNDSSIHPDWQKGSVTDSEGPE